LALRNREAHNGASRARANPRGPQGASRAQSDSTSRQNWARNRWKCHERFARAQSPRWGHCPAVSMYPAPAKLYYSEMCLLAEQSCSRQYRTSKSCTNVSRGCLNSHAGSGGTPQEHRNCCTIHASHETKRGPELCLHEERAGNCARKCRAVYQLYEITLLGRRKKLISSCAMHESVACARIDPKHSNPLHSPECGLNQWTFSCNTVDPLC